MRPPLTGTRSRFALRAKVAAAATAVMALTVFAGSIAHADTPSIPGFTDGYGLTQVSGATEVHSATDFTLTVTTRQLSGQHRIRVFLPRDYAADPGRRWPVVYFLHGGGGTVDDAAAAPALHSDSAITVVPDGGLKGWYADWHM